MLEITIWNRAFFWWKKYRKDIWTRISLWIYIFGRRISSPSFDFGRLSLVPLSHHLSPPTLIQKTLPTTPPLTIQYRRREIVKADCQKKETKKAYVLYSWYDSYSWLPRASTVAQQANISKKRLKIHETLAKAESSLATQICIEKIGLTDFLHRQRVPDVTTPACPCGWPK